MVHSSTLTEPTSGCQVRAVISKLQTVLDVAKTMANWNALSCLVVTRNNGIIRWQPLLVLWQSLIVKSVLLFIRVCDYDEPSLFVIYVCIRRICFWDKRLTFFVKMSHKTKEMKSKDGLKIFR